MTETKHDCDLNWYIYHVMELILGTAFWLIPDKIKTMKPWPRKLFANTVYMCVFMANTKHHVPKKTDGNNGNPRDFTTEKSHIRTRYTLPDIYFVTYLKLTCLQYC